MSYLLQVEEFDCESRLTLSVLKGVSSHMVHKAFVPAKVNEGRTINNRSDLLLSFVLI